VLVVVCGDSVRAGDLARYVDYTPVMQEGCCRECYGPRSKPIARCWNRHRLNRVVDRTDHRA
jgi:hypothetical protein